MKEKDLERHIENMIISGLLKEAEQDDADFKAAMQRMSHEDFLALIMGGRPEKKPLRTFEKIRQEETEMAIQCSMTPAPKTYHRKVLAARPRTRKERTPLRKKILPWVAAAVSAAAILLMVLIPAYDRMDTRVCDSALIACKAFLPPAKGSDDLASASKEEIRDMLPGLEKIYQNTVRKESGVEYAVAPESEENTALKYYTPAPEEAAWNLVEAYLRLGEKDKAAEMLQMLADRYGDSEEGDFCGSLIATLK